MKIISVCLESKLTHSLGQYGFYTVNLPNADEVDDWLSTNSSSVRGRCVVIVDYEKAPNLKNLRVPQNFKIIGLFNDWRLQKKDTTSSRFLFKQDNTVFVETLINMITELSEEREFRQVGEFPLYVDVNEPELDTPFGILPLAPYEHKILLYFAKNPNRIISPDELAFHAFPEGYEYDVETPITNILKVYICKIRKKLKLIIPNPIIKSAQSGGYILEVGCVLFVKRKGSTNHKIHITEQIREVTEKYYNALSQYIAEQSIYELKHNKKLRAHSARTGALKNNLKIKEFSMLRLHTQLKKLKFKAPIKIAHAWENIEAISYTKKERNNDLCIYEE